MKKKILSIIIVVAIALVAGVKIGQEKKEIFLSDVMLNNVEALASGELGWGMCTYYGYYYECSVYEWGIFKGTCKYSRG
ncbi:hypothetical protein D0T51_12290 [Parabacteroides sp. 52]|uniref:NVEALA domain-containing protein n=1 Tax=unclassified Parabacteroides TaxID=2649774 RepID=UPI0013D1B3F0|nr:MULTISPECIES: NVEALA domain-containing protein [unclassified Parabacteroides]MDH6534688.1 hypothetical protein [Parabacteroides sp. PM5-20]NDV56497.1 hypothetical protein [Parabacteroides sp. 52]